MKILNKYFLILIFVAVAASAFFIGTSFGSSPTPSTIQWPNIHQNVETDFNPQIKSPSIQDSSYINAFAVVIGDCHIGKMVLMAPTAVCRGDEGTPIYVSDYSNIQEGVVLHALETTLDGQNLDGRRFSENGDRLLANDSRFDSGYAIFVGSKVSLAHDAMVHGPAWIGNNTFIGMKSLIFDAKIGNNVAVGVYSLVTNGVVISDNKFVPPGSKILTQAQADALPSRIGSSYENINKAVLHVNKDLADAYNQNDLGKIKYYREALMEEEGLVTTQPLP